MDRDFLALVGAPTLRELDDPRLRARLFGALGRRFRTAGWWAIGILVVTGVTNLHFRGLLDPEVLRAADFWSGPLGRALAWKLAAVTAMIVVSALHDFVFGSRASGSGEAGRGPGAADADAGPQGAGGETTRPGAEGAAASALREARRSRKIASWLARVNALLGIVVVLAAVRLARGG